MPRIPSSGNCRDLNYPALSARDAKIPLVLTNGYDRRKYAAQAYFNSSADIGTFLSLRGGLILRSLTAVTPEQCPDWRGHAEISAGFFCLVYSLHHSQPAPPLQKTSDPTKHPFNLFLCKF